MEKAARKNQIQTDLVILIGDCMMDVLETQTGKSNDNDGITFYYRNLARQDTKQLKFILDGYYKDATEEQMEPLNNAAMAIVMLEHIQKKA